MHLLASTSSNVPVVSLLQACGWLLAVAGCSRGLPQATRCSAVCSWRPAGTFAASWPLTPTCCTSTIRARCEQLARPQCLFSSRLGRAALHWLCLV